MHADILRHSFEERSFDLAVMMSQSFGFYSEDTNRELLARLALAVRERGVVILDLWNSTSSLLIKAPECSICSTAE